MFFNEVTRSSSFILDDLVDRNREMALDLRNEEAFSFYMPVTFSLFVLSIIIDESKISIELILSIGSFVYLPVLGKWKLR